jgi:hypothetical protein
MSDSHVRDNFTPVPDRRVVCEVLQSFMTTPDDRALVDEYIIMSATGCPQKTTFSLHGKHEVIGFFVVSDV